MTRPQPDFASAVLDLVAEIPPGNVMSYGDIAAALMENAEALLDRPPVIEQVDLLAAK